MSKYNSYHTNLILLYKFNTLPDEFDLVIPRSTLSNWGKRDVANIIGCDTLADNDIGLLRQIVTNKKLLGAAKALYFVFSTVSTLFKHASNKAELLKEYKSTILDTISKVKSTLGIKRVLKWIGITPSKMYYWLEEKNCQLSLSNLCRPKHPNQLMGSEVKTIKSYLLNDRFRNWSSLSIYYQALRDNAVSIGMHTWYKYARRLGIKRKFFRQKHKPQLGLRAGNPLQILHMDVTIFKPMDNTRIYIYLLVDNYSRYILGWKASLEFSSKISLEVLKSLSDHRRTSIEKYSIDFESKLIVDGGPENRGDVTRYINDHNYLTKLVAQKDIIQSNSMIEAVNKHLKYYYLFKKDLKDYGETVKYLKQSIPCYNNKPHGKLLVLTPCEVLNGEIPSKDKFKEQKEEAGKERLIQNMKVECCEKT